MSFPPASDEDLQRLFRFIPESLREIRADVKQLSEDTKKLQIAIAVKIETMDGLRRDISILEKRDDTKASQIYALQNSNTELKVKVLVGAAIIAGLMQFAMKRLFG